MMMRAVVVVVVVAVVVVVLLGVSAGATAKNHVTCKIVNGEEREGRSGGKGERKRKRGSRTQSKRDFHSSWLLQCDPSAEYGCFVDDLTPRTLPQKANNAGRCLVLSSKCGYKSAAGTNSQISNKQTHVYAPLSPSLSLALPLQVLRSAL